MVERLAATQKKQELPKRLALRCSTCNWRFRSSTIPRLCPNCGDASVAQDSLKGADDILKELDELGKF